MTRRRSRTKAGSAAAGRRGRSGTFRSNGKEPVTNKRVAESLRYLNEDAFRPRTKE